RASAVHSRRGRADRARNGVHAGSMRWTLALAGMVMSALVAGAGRPAAATGRPHAAAAQAPPRSTPAPARAGPVGAAVAYRPPATLRVVRRFAPPARRYGPGHL